MALFFLFCFCPLCRQPWPRLHPSCPSCFWTYSCTSHVRIGMQLLAYLRLVVSVLSYALTTTVSQAILFLSSYFKSAFALPRHQSTVANSHQQLDHRLVPWPWERTSAVCPRTVSLAGGSIPPPVTSELAKDPAQDKKEKVRISRMV